MTLVELLQQNNVDFRSAGQHHHVTSGRIGLDCPHCSPGSQRFRLGFHLEHKHLSCWVCGPLPTYSTLAEITGRSYAELTKFLDGMSGERITTKRQGVLKIPSGVGELQTCHRTYLKSRGFDPDEIKAVWAVQGISLAGRLSWRLFIPVRDQGETVSWTTRSLGDKGLRYVTASPDEESMSPKTLLYGEEYCTHSAVVVEGPIDAWAVGKGTVAVLGLQYTRSQVIRMVKYPRRVICFDNEPQAQRRARKLCRELSTFPGETFRVTLSGKDAASSPKQEIHELRRRFL